GCRRDHDGRRSPEQKQHGGRGRDEPALGRGRGRADPGVGVPGRVAGWEPTMIRPLDSHKATAAIPPGHPRYVVAMLVGLLGMCSLAWPFPATAVPSDAINLPQSLQQYLPGSPAWAASPWVTSPSCRDKGGDFSVWVANVIADIPQFAAVFFTDM